MDKNWIAPVGPEVGENLGLRYLASALSQAGFHCDILAFNSQRDYPRILRSLVESDPRFFLIGLSLAFQWRAQEFLALAMALREHGYPGHITAGGHFATFASEDLLHDDGATHCHPSSPASEA